MARDAYPEQSEHAGWSSDFRAFRETSPRYIRKLLQSFVRDASFEQIQAWDESIPRLQAEATELAASVLEGDKFSAILEYRLPMEHRRPDVILLASGPVVVLELKGKQVAARVDLDQAAAYARDLRGYHRECADRMVIPALVLMRAGNGRASDGVVEVLGPEALDELVADASARFAGPAVPLDRFLDPGAYRPLPSLVEAARELLKSGEIRRIGIVDEKTRPTLNLISEIAREAARTKTRRLVLLTGLPGTGKTLVGLQLAHARFLDDLAVPRSDGKPTAPAVYLSGNGPLVEVLQYELRSAGGDGKAFVRGVKAYVATYSKRPDLIPPEHVLIFDEAQRAFDAAQVARKHNGGGDGRSEPEHFVEFAERVPDWCVVVGLIGSVRRFTPVRREVSASGAMQWSARPVRPSGPFMRHPLWLPSSPVWHGSRHTTHSTCIRNCAFTWRRTSIGSYKPCSMGGPGDRLASWGDPWTITATTFGSPAIWNRAGSTSESATRAIRTLVLASSPRPATATCLAMAFRTIGFRPAEFRTGRGSPPAKTTRAAVPAVNYGPA